MLLLPFAHVDAVVARDVWRWVSLAFYLAAVGLLTWAYPRHASGRRIGWALAHVGLLYTLLLGQIYTALLVLVVAAWLLLERRQYAVAGVIIGLIVAIKPTFAVWAGLLFVGGFTIAGLWAFASAAVLSALPAVMFGPGIYAQWLTATGAYASYPLAINGSILGFMSRLGLAVLGLPLSVLFLGGVAIWIRRRRPDVVTLSGVALTAMLLASPLAWFTNFIWLLPVHFRGRWTVSLWSAALLLALPELDVWNNSQLSAVHLVVFGAIYPLVLVLILYSQVSAPAGVPAPEPQPARSGVPPESTSREPVSKSRIRSPKEESGHQRLSK